MKQHKLNSCPFQIKSSFFVKKKHLAQYSNIDLYISTLVRFGPINGNSTILNATCILLTFSTLIITLTEHIDQIPEMYTSIPA